MYKENVSKRWCCRHCDYGSSNATDVARHVEARHVYTEGVTCPYCAKHCPTTNALRVHCIRKHKNEQTEKSLISYEML